MTNKWSIFFLVVVSLLSSLNTVFAQQSADMLSGYWKHKQESIYIQVVNLDGRYEAEIVRNDWVPGLVGTKFFHNVVEVENKKNRWAGESAIQGSNNSGRATLNINRAGELRSKRKPGGRITWVRSDPVEKRY